MELVPPGVAGVVVPLLSGAVPEVPVPLVVPVFGLLVAPGVVPSFVPGVVP